MWKPKVGDRIKLKAFHDYTRLGLSPWGWFEVLELRDKGLLAKTILCAAGVESQEIGLSYDWIQAPLGWEQVYEMTGANEEQARLMQSWLETRGGICVWSCVDLSMAGRKMFTPGDKTEKPHWAYELIEIVTDPARCDIGFEVIRHTKPDRHESQKWTYDNSLKIWYRREKLSDATHAKDLAHV